MKGALVLVALLAGLSFAGPAERAIPGVPNPHGDPKGCASCHETTASGGVGAAKPPTATCRTCHPTADPHPVGIAPVDVKVAEGWPLEEGKLGCWTCHVEPAHGGKDASNPAPFFRGGPYSPRTNLCFQCHERTTFARTDPHHPDDLRAGTDGACQACHAGIPATGAAPEDSELLVDAELVCGTCHGGSLHLGVGDHVGKEVEATARAALPTGIALDADGRIQCWSCHEVHDPTPPVGKRWTGNRPLAAEIHDLLLDAGWDDALPDGVVWPGSEAGDHPSLLGQPLQNGALCHACHGDGP